MHRMNQVVDAPLDPCRQPDAQQSPSEHLETVDARVQWNHSWIVLISEHHYRFAFVSGGRCQLQAVSDGASVPLVRVKDVL